jgi:hypothetical protein
MDEKPGILQRVRQWLAGAFTARPRPPRSAAAQSRRRREDPALEAMVLPLGVVLLEEERLREQAAAASPAPDRDYDPDIDDPEIHDLLE